MTDAWTRLAKPTGTPYTSINGEGLHTYDDSLVLFDDPTVSFDGGDGNEWVPIAKPTGRPWTSIAKPTT